MTADVVVGADLLVIVADDDDGGPADVEGDVVAGLGELGDGGREDPRRVEDRLEVASEKVRVRVEGSRQRVAGLAVRDRVRPPVGGSADTVEVPADAEAAVAPEVRVRSRGAGGLGRGGPWWGDSCGRPPLGIVVIVDALLASKQWL